MKKSIIILVFLLSILLGGCKPKSSLATLQCKKIETYESAAGWLNLNNSELGHVVRIDTKSMTGAYVGQLDLKKEDYATPGKKISKKKLNLELEYDINFSGGDAPNDKYTHRKRTIALDTSSYT